MKKKYKDIIVFDKKTDLFNIKKNKKKPISNNNSLFGYVVKKPWGYEYIAYENKDISISILVINKKSKTSMHLHELKKTSLFVLKNQFHIRHKYVKDNYSVQESYKLLPGQFVTIEKMVLHSTSNDTSSNGIVMEIENPNLKNDLIRFNDDYGRKNIGYEKNKTKIIDYNKYKILKFNQKKENFGDCYLYIANFFDILKISKNDYSKICSITLVKGKFILKKNKYQPGDVLTPDFFWKNKKNIRDFNKLSFLIIEIKN